MWGGLAKRNSPCTDDKAAGYAFGYPPYGLDTPHERGMAVLVEQQGV